MAIAVACIGVGSLAGAVRQTRSGELALEGEEASRPRLTFNFLPRSLQSKPKLNCNVITELTGEGRKRAPKLAVAPQYYVIQAGGYLKMGDGAPAGEIPLSDARLIRALTASLAESGFQLSSSPAQRPTLAVIYSYGSHTSEQLTIDDAAAEANAWRDYEDRLVSSAPGAFIPSPSTALGQAKGADEWLGIVLGDLNQRRQVLERAALVGGKEFAKQLREVLEQEVTFRQAQHATSRFLGRPGTTLAFPVSMPESNAASPFQQFRRRNWKRMHLVESAFASCYFVVASAYDYRELAAGRKVLLWRTRMSVDSDGIGLAEAAPALIASAGPYFGQEMKDPAMITRQVSRKGRIELGEPEVVGEGPSATTVSPRP